MNKRRKIRNYDDPRAQLVKKNLDSGQDKWLHNK